MTPEKKFDPWSWLGVECGGFHSDVDSAILMILEAVRDGDLVGYFECETPTRIEYRQLICTLLCNTDAFEFDDDPTQLRFVGDERFKTLDDLISAWDDWYGSHYR